MCAQREWVTHQNKPRIVRQSWYASIHNFSTSYEGDTGEKFPFRTFSTTTKPRAQNCRSIPFFHFSDHYQGSLPARYFASKSSAPDEIESLRRSETKAVRFKIDAVEMKIEAVEVCLRRNSTEVANSTNIHVQTYKSLTKAQLRKEKEQLQDEENKLLDLLLEEMKNSRGSGGKASYLAFFVWLLFLNLVPRWISLRPSPLICILFANLIEIDIHFHSQQKRQELKLTALKQQRQYFVCLLMSMC